MTRFVPGTTAVKHGELISFLSSENFGILHTPYKTGVWDYIKSYADGSYFLENEELTDTLLSEGILTTGDSKGGDLYTVEFDKLQPLHFLTIITNRCNMDCRYCYTESNNHIDDVEIQTEDWIRIFEEMYINSPVPAQNISFTGGEPTVYEGLPDIIASISNKYKFDISSNGLYINDKLIETLGNAKTLQCFNISMDSNKPEEDEYYRGKGTYYNRLKTIERLLSVDIPLCISMTVGTANLGSIEATTRFFLDKYPVSIKYIPLTKMGKAINMDDTEFIGPNETKTYSDSVAKMRAEYGNNVIIDPSDIDPKNEEFHWSGRCSHMKVESRKMNDFTVECISYGEKCNAGYGVVALSPGGRLRPCLRPDSFFGFENDVQMTMPIISEKTRKEIESLEFWEIVSKKSGKFDSNSSCALKTLIGGKDG